jgi:hypothetical protein
MESNADRFRFAGWPPCNHYWLPIRRPVTVTQEPVTALDSRPYARCTMCGATRPESVPQKGTQSSGSGDANG